MDMFKVNDSKKKEKDPKEKKDNDLKDMGMFSEFLDSVRNINDSKIFAGIMIIILNVASKFVNIKLSKTMESYLKNSFSRTILVFAIAWMGTRDLWVALGICIVFTFVMDYLLNEESAFCMLPETFTDYHVTLLDDEKKCKFFTKEDVERSIEILTRAKDILDRSTLGSIHKQNPSTIDIDSDSNLEIPLEKSYLSQMKI